MTEQKDVEAAEAENDICNDCNMPLDDFGCCDNPDCEAYDYADEDDEDEDSDEDPYADIEDEVDPV